jgi:ATP-dependent helicase/nuclease subunit B
LARERPLAMVAARYVVTFERLRRTADLTILPEQQGALAIRAPFAPFIVEARADRLEITDGRAKVLDFKTGRAPSQKEVESGFAPQLTLTGGILMKGGFENAGAVEPSHLVYVRVTGRRDGGEEIERAGPGEAAILAEEALARLGEYVTRFDDEATPYISWSAPQFMSQYGGDYDHLARVWEWAVVGDTDSGSGSE